MTIRPKAYPYLQPKYPAILFNESGSMRVFGRIEKSMELIGDLVRQNSADYYINTSYTGLPRFIANLPQFNGMYEDGYYPFGQPLLPLPTGDDHMNSFALAALIEEYPEGVHLIDDGDGTVGWVSHALHALKNDKSSGYMHPVTVYMLKGMKRSDRDNCQRQYDRLKQYCPDDEGFNVRFYYVPCGPEGIDLNQLKHNEIELKPSWE